MLQEHPTVDELVSILRRSKLPTVVVEGKDDMRVFRWMEDLVKAHEVDVLGVGGRPNLLREAYQLQLRGKQLFQMLVRFLSAPNRSAKYSYHGLHEIAFKMTSFHPLMNRLIQEIEQKITAHSLTL